MRNGLRFRTVTDLQHIVAETVYIRQMRKQRHEYPCFSIRIIVPS